MERGAANDDGPFRPIGSRSRLLLNHLRQAVRAPGRWLRRSCPLGSRIFPSYDRRWMTLVIDVPGSIPHNDRPLFSIQVSMLWAPCRLPARQFRAISWRG